MTGVLRAKVNGEWVDVSTASVIDGGGGGGVDEVVIALTDPIVANPGVELWYDPDAPSIPGEPGPPGPAGPAGDPGPQPRGAWSPVVTYQPDDVVTREGSAWIATVESTGVDPAGDASHTVIGSLTSPSGLALGSPTAVAQTFTVDRPMTALAINALAAFTGPPYDGLVGIASAINVPAVGVQWIGKGDPDATGYTLLDAPVALSVGVEYWFVMKLSQANVYIDQGADLIGSHIAWGNDFWYGSGEPSNDFGGTYGLPFVLYGTTGDDAWQLFVARGEPGPVGPLDILTDVTIASPADGQSVVYEATSSQWKNIRLDATDILTSPAWGSGSVETVLNFLWGETVKVQQSVIISTTDPIVANPNAELWFDPDA